MSKMAAKQKKHKWNKDYAAQQLPLHAMLLIPLILVLLYNYFPMIGSLMAFQNYVPTLRGFLPSLFGSKFIGLSVFRDLFSQPSIVRVFSNTVFISAMKIAADIVFPLAFALMLNEIRTSWFKKTVQTVTYLPYFMSWVILSGILLDIFSPREGVVNQMLNAMGMNSIYFFGDSGLFPYMLVSTNIWKEIGFNTIIILAAITGIDPSLYEAAVIDGAKRVKQTIYVTLPSVLPMVVLLFILSLGNILNAGFDQVFNLYSPSVYSTGDIIDTYVYRTGLLNGQYSLATAVGLFKSVISTVMIVLSYMVANKYSDYRVF